MMSVPVLIRDHDRERGCAWLLGKQKLDQVVELSVEQSPDAERRELAAGEEVNAIALFVLSFLRVSHGAGRVGVPRFPTALYRSR